MVGFSVKNATFVIGKILKFIKITRGGGKLKFWPPINMDSCHFDCYDILYEGTAIRLTPKEATIQPGPTVYTVTTADTTFALTRTTEVNLCGYKLYNTEHPKLLILETQPGKTFRIRA
jgi:hypothetical protein